MKRTKTTKINHHIPETEYQNADFKFVVHKVSGAKYIYVYRLKDADGLPCFTLEKKPLRITRLVLALLEQEMPVFSALIDRKSASLWDVNQRLVAACNALGGKS